VTKLGNSTLILYNAGSSSRLEDFLSNSSNNLHCLKKPVFASFFFELSLHIHSPLDASPIRGGELLMGGKKKRSSIHGIHFGVSLVHLLGGLPYEVPHD
jgi:hypothetical protein